MQSVIERLADVLDGGLYLETNRKAGSAMTLLSIYIIVEGLRLFLPI
jgi:hypothetical protein